MKLTNPDLSISDANALFQRIDQDGNHCISFIEFLAAALDPSEVDANEIKQAFRLIDREEKGYISRDDVWRILDTTNVQDLEALNTNHNNNYNKSSGTSTTAASYNSATGANNSGFHGGYGTGGGGGGGGGAYAEPHPYTHPQITLSSLGSAAGLVGPAGAFVAGLMTQTSRRSSSAGSLGSNLSSEAALEMRNKKLEQRIDEIMLQADVNNDGVIRLAPCFFFLFLFFVSYSILLKIIALNWSVTTSLCSRCRVEMQRTECWARIISILA
jgi:hypothetical protein